jgi:hypothetical protein
MMKKDLNNGKNGEIMGMRSLAALIEACRF